MLVRDRKELEFLRYRESVLVDEQTWVAENLDAPLEKPLVYSYRDDELWSEQAEPLGKIFHDSVVHYDTVTRFQPELRFQYRRSLAELAEYEHMKAMARGEAANTFVVVSPYPKELAKATKDVLGYQPKRKLGFIRVITRTPDGVISMWTHSLDNSDNHEAINAIYQSLGVSYDDRRDALEQPIACDMAYEDQQAIGDTLMGQYDRSLQTQFGGSWHAGRSSDDWREAITFVSAQRDLLHAHVDAIVHLGTNHPQIGQLRYDFAAAMRRRFEGDVRFRQADSVASEMASAGNDAANRGETASGCGLSLTATSEQMLSQAGYSVERKRAFTYGTCAACIQPKMVGECSVCLGCEMDDNRGADLMKRREARLRELAQEQKNATALSTPIETKTLQASTKRRTVSNLEYTYELRVGGVEQYVIDKQTGEKRPASL